ncbi:MAG: cytochrome c biogenesis protein CcsA [Chitinophagaceae bacterium]|nr:cytochrome c biogenesis protein CcsA [Chitinophagaceae bacterium]
MRKSWWKIACVLLLAYSVIGGLLLPVPRRDILNETIRNLYYHVPMWFTMILLFSIAFAQSIKYLRNGKLQHDIKAASYTKVGIFFSILGMITGMEWAKFTWGEPWSNDPKQLGTAICMLIYFAYLILRGGMKDEEKRAKISAVYNIFAFALMIPLIWILPRMVDSLHPGNGGNPGFNAYDLDNTMRPIFYPAVIGWFLLGLWIANLLIRTELITFKKEHEFLSES